MNRKVDIKLFLEVFKNNLSGYATNEAIGEEVFYSYREENMINPEDKDDVSGFDRSTVCRWRKGQRKLDKKIREFYLVNGQQKARLDIEYIKDEVRSIKAFSEELYKYVMEDDTIPEDIKEAMLLQYLKGEYVEFLAMLQLYILDTVDTVSPNKHVVKELPDVGVDAVLDIVLKEVEYDSIHHTGFTEELMARLQKSGAYALIMKMHALQQIG